MDYSNLCLIFWDYWHVSFWITQKKSLNKWITQIFVSFFRSTSTCQKWSTARAKKWSTLTLSRRKEKKPHPLRCRFCFQLVTST